MSAVFNIAYKKKKKTEPISEDTVFYFTSPEAFSVKTPATQTWDGDLEYSQDGDTWLTAGPNGTIAQNADGKIYFRGTGNTHLQDSTSKSSFFAFTGNDISCYGNCLVLLDYKKVEQNDEIEIASYCFSYLFYSCSNLIVPPTLPATNLAPYCYYAMFDGCTSLTSAPALPATALAEHCYHSMFATCTSLTSAPALPAITLAASCYRYMFSKCTSLTSAPALPATTLAAYCYNYMFFKCTSLTSAPALPATILAENCCESMFAQCTSLTSAPALPATALATHCYDNMFSKCTSLTSAPALPATTLARYCYYAMFSDCTSLAIVPALPATNLAQYCYIRMFNGCTSLSMKAVSDGVIDKISWRIPYNSSDSISEAGQGAVINMFANTQTDNITEPTLNTTYYTSAVVLPSGKVLGS